MMTSSRLAPVVRCAEPIAESVGQHVQKRGHVVDHVLLIRLGAMPSVSRCFASGGAISLASI